MKSITDKLKEKLNDEIIYRGDGFGGTAAEFYCARKLQPILARLIYCVEVLEVYRSRCADDDECVGPFIEALTNLAEELD
jgi:hypothetical protein